MLRVKTGEGKGRRGRTSGNCAYCFVLRLHIGVGNRNGIKPTRILNKGNHGYLARVSAANLVQVIAAT